MKTNTEYKNAALAALKGNWAKAVLASVVVIAIMYLGLGPYLSHYFKMQHFMAENLVSAGDPSLMMDPEYQALTAKTMLWWGFYLLFAIFVIQPMSVGFDNASLRLLRFGENDILGNTWQIATKKYWRKVWGMFLMGFYIFLWSLLFIIPGIILIVGLMMASYILKDDQEISAMDALKKSWELTKGHKMKLFWLGFSFIGWIILSLMTLGIGFFFLVPYMDTTFAHYYEEDIKAA